MKHKFLKFISVFLLLMSSLTAWSATTSYPVYFCPGAAGKSWTTPYVNCNKGWNGDWQNYSMSKSSFTFHGYDVYQATIVTHDGGSGFDEVCFHPGQNDYSTELKAPTGWPFPYGGKIYDGSNWQNKAEDSEQTFYFCPKVAGKDWTTPYANCNLGYNHWSNVQMTEVFGKTFCGQKVYQATVTTCAFDKIEFHKSSSDYSGKIELTNPSGVNGKLYNGSAWKDFSYDTEYTFYFATDWSAVYANCNLGYNIWKDLAMTNTGKTYNGKKIYSITVAAQGFNDIEFHKSQGGDWDSKVVGYSNSTTYKKDFTNALCTSANNWVAYNYDVTLTFDPRNGGATTNKVTLKGGSITAPSAPSKTGYTFQGWGTGKVAAGGTISNVQADATYDAQWTANQYTVTLDAKGGSDGTDKVTATYGAAMPSATMPTKTGYDFQGYYDTDGSTSGNWGTQYYNNTGESVRAWDKASTATLYAKWTPQVYEITYKDQGDAEFSGTHEDGHPTTHTYGTATTLKSATKTGFEFLGWYKESACTNKVTSLGATDYTDNITLYAKWESANRTIAYGVGTPSAGKGSISAKNTDTKEDITSGSSQPMSTPITFTATPNDYYDVEGWYSDAACEHQITEAGTNKTYAITLSANTTVYVKFVDHKYDLQITHKYYQTDGNTEITDYKQTDAAITNCVGVETTYDINATSASKVGFYHTKWTIPAGTIKYNGEEYSSSKNIETDNLLELTINGWIASPNQQIQMQDRWVEYSRTVTVGAVHGTIQDAVSSLTDIGVYTGKSVTAIANTGYDFSGWTTTPNSNYIINLSAADALTTEVRVSSSQSAAAAGSITANFVAQKYNITYMDMGAVAFSGIHEEGYPTQHTYDQTTTLKTASKTGYTFKGWFTDSECTEGHEVTTIGGQDYTAAFTLYAKWEINSYTITYPDASAQTSGHYTINADAPKKADYNEAVHFTVTPDYGYAVGTVSSSQVTITKSGEQYSFTMGAENVIVNVNSSTIIPCDITVVNSSKGTITKVSQAPLDHTDMLTTHEFSFEPNEGQTFMKWDLTNARCVEGTNERSNPIKIQATAAGAKIGVNMKETVANVTLKVTPDVNWGYFRVNGNNVASGTVINVGLETTSTVEINTNFGYRLKAKQWSDDYDQYVTYNESTHVMKGTGKAGNVTLIAEFEVDTYTSWKISGNLTGEQAGWTSVEFAKHSDQNTKKIAYATVHLNNNQWLAFKLQKGSDWYSCPGTMDDNHNGYRFGWIFKKQDGDNTFFHAFQDGDYVFRLDYNDENNPTLTLLFPNSHWFPTPTTIYFNNKNFEGEWGSPKVRFGCDGGIAEAYTMSLVPGTANLYSYTFLEGYKYFDAWQITDNYGWTGAKDKTNETTYGFHNIGEDKYKIKCATKDDKTAATTETVVKISSTYASGNFDVKYFDNTTWNSLDASRYSVTFANKNLTGGTLKVEQWENNDGSARTELNTGTTKVDQSRWITITATPQVGYKFVNMSVTTSGGTSTHAETTWKYAVHQDITAITATFERVNTYTFYVKNVVSTDTRWHAGGTKDVYLYYDNGKKDGEGKVSYWGWPGLMATPMDKNHEWYKVEMTNAYFTIGNWILNNGVGPDCPQTIHYAAENGVPKFGGQEMEGKYYEIVQKGEKFNTYELQVASTTPSFYRVVSENGKYTSNVAKVGETVSFFATQANGAKLQKSSNGGWTDVTGGTIAINKNTVWVATVGATGVTNLEPYTGNYYIRTDGASGQWGEYKDPSKNNAMTYFTRRQGETYSYYWVENLGKLGQSESSGSFNVKAKVANDYNDNLAGEIANDANTNIYGNINKTTNGSNVRFSYEPTTNLFERAILSGSADDSYLNIVGENIYSDVSCKNEFALDENTYKTNPKACKLRDISDWVYEMTIYAEVPNNTTNIGVDMYSLYNGNRSTLLDNKVIMASGTGEGKYKLRATYDFKKNRITTSWSPSSQMITETMTVNADIQFLQVEKGDVSQITLSTKTNPNVKSLEYLLYVLEIEDPGESKRGEEHYRISLPFDCRVSDIYGLENYVKLNEAGQPISGDWGIQKYNGELRAQQGWYDNSPIQNFWTWLSKDDTLKAGRGYSVSIDKSAFTWATIGEEVTRTICDANGTNCQDITTTEDRASHRLYFPSINPGFDLKNSSAQAINYPEIHCEKTQGRRDIYDSDWRFIGSSAYNNITTKQVTPEQTIAPAPAYLYVLNSAETEYEAVAAAKNFVYHSFGAYMMQFHGDIEWNIYTQSHPESQAPARRYSAIAHAPLKMHVDVIEGEEMAAQAFVELNDQATTGFDQKMDLTLMKSSKVARAYTTTEGIDYAANCLPFESTIVPLTINTLHAGDYTLHLEGADNVAVYLIDYLNQSETLISAGDVEVELTKGSSSDRFALRFDVAASPTDSKNAKGETIVNDGQKTQKLLINDNIYLINGGRVYNASGTKVR